MFDFLKLLIIFFLFMSNSAEVFCADDVLVAPLPIQNVSANVYVCQKQEDLFFVLEKLDQQTAEIQSSRRKRDQITDDFRYWSDFNKTQKSLIESQAYRDQLGYDVGNDYYDGITSFGEMFESAQVAGKRPWGDKCELWVAYASYVLVYGRAYKQNLSYADIEMSFGVFNDKDLPFTVHMGISRSLSAKEAGRSPHSRISVDLHSFAARVMQSLDPRKEYMITVPLKGMRDILQTSLPQGSVFIGDDKHVERVRTATSGDKKILLERDNLRDMDESAATEYADQLFEMWTPLLETCPPRISHAYAVMPSGYTRAITFMLVGKDGSAASFPMCSSGLVVHYSRYDWFFISRVLSPRVELPYVVVDLEVLAGIRNF